MKKITDKERLDFIEQKERGIQVCDGTFYVAGAFDWEGTVRDAIDAAIRSESRPR